MSYVQPLANGIRTDHPIPGLPFVEDDHIPVDDPAAVEAIGRHSGTGTWGRFDQDRTTGEWAAFTTDPKNPQLGWVVRFHPEHGRSVLLYRDSAASSAYSSWFRDKPLLARVGGYWWDGATWYRPGQVIDWSTERYVRRTVTLPEVITAADLLDSCGRAELGATIRVMQAGGEKDAVELACHQLQGGAPGDAGGQAAAQRWRHDLALWASRRPEGALPLAHCTVALNAPELHDGALLGVDEVADEAGLAASTLRAYIARGEADVPDPQATEGPRKRWAKPVIADWIEQRRRDPGQATALLNTPGGDNAGQDDGDPAGSLSPGLRALWRRLTDALHAELWRDPPARRRWARPHRTEHAVRNVSTHLGWVAALHLQSTVPFTALAEVLEHDVLWQMRDYETDHPDVSLFPQTGQLLGWLIEHRPSAVPVLFGTIVREAHRLFGVPPETTTSSLREAVHMDGGFSNRTDQLDEFLDLVLPPTTSEHRHVSA